MTVHAAPVLPPLGPRYLPTIYVDGDENCCRCYKHVEDNHTYYLPPCGHLYCYICMTEEARLDVCWSCAQSFIMASPTQVLVKNHLIVIDDEDDADGDEDDVDDDEASEYSNASTVSGDPRVDYV